MSLTDRYRVLGGVLAPDGIPLNFGDQQAEYHAALERVVLMDRSHEGRIEARGRDRLALIQRISTNDVLNLKPGEGQPTIFTNPTGRILDRAMVYNRGETALLTAEPGRGAPLLNYLQRQVFFNDEAAFADISAATHQFVLHGPQADALVEALTGKQTAIAQYPAVEMTIAGVSVYAIRRKPVSGAHWALIVPAEQAETVWDAVMESGVAFGLTPAGSLVYNALRIRAGRPAAGRELTADYIPLEAGLWDEVSFAKGCYTGQEIIARMESRGKLAKTMITLKLSASVESPVDLLYEGKSVGSLTSSVVTPDNEILGIGFIKVAVALPDQTLVMADGKGEAVITALAGAQPPQLVTD